jgi:nicotinic acid mononucleotide adenylyltransferase
MSFKLKIEKVMAIGDVSERRAAADNLYASHLSLATEADTLLWKIARDPYYPQTYLRYGNKVMVEAGFFDDQIPLTKNGIPVADVAKFLTPKSKINIDPSSKKNIVVVLTGAFCPIHKGHVEILEIARKELEERGYHVAGGYVCPDNQTYIVRKYKKDLLSEKKRVALCEKMVKDSEWIDVSKLGMYGFAKDVNYTEIIYHMQQTFSECSIAYVYGSDNAGFSWLFEDGNVGVCIKRDEDGGKFEKYQEMFENIDNVIFSDTERRYSNLSSTKIRRMSSAPVYLIRDDTKIVTADFMQFASPRKIDLANAIMVKKIARIIKQRIPSEIKVKTITVEEQTKMFLAEFPLTTPVISLDLHFRGDYQIGLTRVFEYSGKQESPLCFVSRNTFSSEEDDISMIPPGKYILVDDDAASGGTLDYIIEKLLDRDIVVKDIFLMNRVVGENFFDVVDMRDFIIGSTESGLTIKRPDGLFSAPYCFPYVNLTSRAKLDECKNASYEIWKANLEYYNFLCPGLQLSCLGNGFVDLMVHSGISINATVESVCKHHMDLCKPTSK